MEQKVLIFKGRSDRVFYKLSGNGLSCEKIKSNQSIKVSEFHLCVRETFQSINDIVYLKGPIKSKHKKIQQRKINVKKASCFQRDLDREQTDTKLCPRYVHISIPPQKAFLPQR